MQKLGQTITNINNKKNCLKWVSHKPSRKLAGIARKLSLLPRKPGRGKKSERILNEGKSNGN